MSEPAAKSRQAIAEEAAEWFVLLQEKSPARSIKKRFTTWLTESPVHVEEYLGVAQVFGALQDVDPKREIDIESLADDTVVALHGEFDGSARMRAGGRVLQATRMQRLWVAAASIAVAIGAVSLYIQETGPDIYGTRVGEQRSVLLEDGSMVTLNTSTRIEVAYTEDTRQVRLVQGEALFDVEKDVARPFLVETRAAVIRVTGTRFNVYENYEGTAVTVLEGQVEIVPRGIDTTPGATKQSPGKSSGSAGGVARLAAGDQAVVKSGSAEIETITVASLEPVTAWTERRLVFDATPLAEIVRQFNRYNRERLVLEDPTLASLELSGVFGSNDPESLVLFLRRIADIEVVTSADGSEIRIRAASTSR